LALVACCDSDFINLSHPWQNVDALSRKSMLARLRHHVARVSPLPCILRQTRPVVHAAQNFKISGGTQYSKAALTCSIATSDFTLFILQQSGLKFP
jgi:hypothetical protein